MCRVFCRRLSCTNLKHFCAANGTNSTGCFFPIFHGYDLKLISNIPFCSAFNTVHHHNDSPPFLPSFYLFNINQRVISKARASIVRIATFVKSAR